MDLTYEVASCHGSNPAYNGALDSNGTTNCSGLLASRISLAQAARLLARGPLYTARELAAYGVSLQSKAVLSTIWAAGHPIQALNKTKGFVLRPFGNLSGSIGTVISTVESVGQLTNARSAKERDDGREEEMHRAMMLEALEANLQAVVSYKEFEHVARRLGELDDFYDWQNEEYLEVSSYDAQCVMVRLHALQAALRNGDQLEMVHLVRTQLGRYLGEMDSPALFVPNRIGTKALVEMYTEAVCDVLREMAAARYDKQLERNVMTEQLKLTRQAFGRTALLLSGGGTLGMQNIGVVKALFEAGSLPRIVCGSSAGAIVASVLCTKQDHQIEEVLESFCNGDLKVFVGDDEKEGILARIAHFWRRGHLFNAENLRRVMKYHLGDLTFREGYHKTGRILNITVSSANTNESIRLLNYATTGDVVIWSAVVASCALPFGYEPGPLMHKDRNGSIERWDEHTLHVDGSIEGDLPFEKVSSIFNVNYFIVSQVNPHVTPFLEDHSQAWDKDDTLWDALLCFSRAELADWLHPELMPLFDNLRRKASSIIGQRYTGDITILPRDSTNLFLNVLSNPTISFMQEASRNGELATWALLNRIKSHIKIEVAIDNAVRKAEENTSFSASASDLRRLELEQMRRLSQSGRRGTRPSSSGSGHQSTKSAITPGRVQRHRVSHRPAKSMIEPHFDSLGNAATKVAGHPYSPSSCSTMSRASFSLSDAEAELHGGVRSKGPPEVTEAELQAIEPLTAPNSPTQSFRTFDSPRSRSPVTAPSSLIMTPASDDVRPAAQRSRQRMTEPVQPLTASRPAPTPPDTKRSTASNGGNNITRYAGLDRFRKKITRRRSSSTG